MSTLRQTKIAVIALAVVMFLNGTKPMIGWLPVWMIFDGITESTEPLSRRVTTAYSFWEDREFERDTNALNADLKVGTTGECRHYG